MKASDQISITMSLVEDLLTHSNKPTARHTQLSEVGFLKLGSITHQWLISRVGWAINN